VEVVTREGLGVDHRRLALAGDTITLLCQSKPHARPETSFICVRRIRSSTFEDDQAGRASSIEVDRWRRCDLRAWSSLTLGVTVRAEKKSRIGPDGVDAE